MAITRNLTRVVPAAMLTVCVGVYVVAYRARGIVACCFARAK